MFPAREIKACTVLNCFPVEEDTAGGDAGAIEVLNILLCLFNIL
jgi:hypothetical protein